jgi:hypothetical protein
MKYLKYILFFFVISFYFLGCKSTSNVGPLEANQKYSEKKLHEDLDYVSRTINEVHPAFYKNVALIGSLENKLNSQKKSINTSLTRHEFFTLLAPVITNLNDGHTTLGVPWNDISNYLDEGGLIFPFDIFFVEGETFIYRNYSNIENLSPGTRLLSINNIPIEIIVSNLTKMLSGANISWRLRRMERQSDFFKALLWLEYGWSDDFKVTYSSNGQINQGDIPGITKQRLRSQRDTTESDPAFEYRMVEDNIGLLSIRYFGEGEKEFNQFLKSSFKTLTQNKINHLVIDVRDNPGGDSGQAEELLSYVMKEPIPITTTVTPRASQQFKSKMKQRIPRLLRWLPLQYLDKRGRKIWRIEEGNLLTIEESPIQPKAKSERFIGDIYVLINEGTFSAASIFASAFKREQLGLLIGRETGGEGGVMYAEPLTFLLPNTQLSLRVSSMIFVLGSENLEESTIGIAPNIVVQKNIDDEIQHIDTVLEQTLRYIKNSSSK